MASSERASELIAVLGMQPHPEGGYYVEIHRSAMRVQPADARPARSALTTIFFLLTAGDISRWHRVIGSDEVWHFHEGAPLELFTAGLEFETFDRHVVGPLTGSQRPVHVVEAGVWQAARSTGEYTLVACSVGPGFDFADFEMLRDDPAAAARARLRQPDASGLL